MGIKMMKELTTLTIIVTTSGLEGKSSSNSFYLDALDAAKGLIFNPVAAYQYDDDSRHLNAKPVI